VGKVFSHVVGVTGETEVLDARGAAPLWGASDSERQVLSREGRSPVSPITQVVENKPLATTDKPDSNTEKQNLVSGLFSALENDPDLRLIAGRWPKLSVELRQAIVRMVQ
jgi:hypothetical protein